MSLRSRGGLIGCLLAVLWMMNECSAYERALSSGWIVSSDELHPVSFVNVDRAEQAEIMDSLKTEPEGHLNDRLSIARSTAAFGGLAVALAMLIFIFVRGRRSRGDIGIGANVVLLAGDLLILGLTALAFFVSYVWMDHKVVDAQSFAVGSAISVGVFAYACLNRVRLEDSSLW